MEKNSVIVEYLIITKQEDTFCDNVEAFIKFLGVDSSLTILDKENKIAITLKKKDEFQVSYSLVSDLVPSKKERYFKLILSSKEKDKLKEFNELTDLVEKIIDRLQNEVSINILWNDISREYAIKGYALINEVENLLRRLITSFMLINVGYDWHKNHIPSGVESRETYLKGNYSDYLHQTYFSDLKTILFEGQRDIALRNIGDIQKLVEKSISENKKEIPVDDLKGVISISLWEKHFAKEAKYKKKDLEEDLEKLNGLRNEIAHNRHISRENLGKVENLSKKIINALKLEIEDLPNKVLTPEEKVFQAERETMRIAEHNHPSMFGYLAEEVVFKWYQKLFGPDKVSRPNPNHMSGIDIVVAYAESTFVFVHVKSTSLRKFVRLRSEIVHGAGLEGIFPMGFNASDEYHLTIVLNDLAVMVNKSEIALAVGLSELIKEINPQVRLILGNINENNEFRQIV